MNIRGFVVAIAMVSLYPWFAAGTLGQDTPASGDDAPGFESLGDFGGLEFPGGFGMDGGGEELILTGSFSIVEGTQKGTLRITAKLAPGWHTYALDQKGGPGPGEFSISAPGLQVTGSFKPDHPPEVRTVEYFEVPLREHYGEVTWSVPIRLSEGVDPSELKIDAKFNGQICEDTSGCRPIFDEPIEIPFSGYEAAPASQGQTGYRASRSHVVLTGTVHPAVVGAGGIATVSLTATPDGGWHVYAWADKDPQEIAKPTLIAMDSPAGWIAEPPGASTQPIEEQILPDEPSVRYHEGPVTWSVRVAVPENAPTGEVALSGIIGYQACSDNSCDPPLGARFTAALTVGDVLTDQSEPLVLAPASYAEADKMTLAVATAEPEVEQPLPPEAESSTEALDLSNLNVQASGQDEYSLIAILGFAFLGGFILNFMPCVLPVLGLKVMSFVQQAGESRGKVFALNVWYSAGLISVFLVLATLAAVWKFGWGEQFNFDVFNITMAAVVFTMGLSFLGVWEIPLPGFVGGGKANEFAAKEGPAGAFAKGVITTILATPCSGPGLAVALAWSANKPAPLVYMVFAVMGLGMASPYLVIGANPNLARFIPKPGMWMETFKEILGFVLLGTVVYILTFVHWANVVPTIALLFGLWAACWWIGRIPFTAATPKKIRSWVGAAAFAALIGLFAFGDRVGVGQHSTYGLWGIMDYRLGAYVDRQLEEELEQLAVAPAAEDLRKPDNPFELPWQPFSVNRLSEFTGKNRTVMVDFTANWCLTCKYLETTVLNTEDVRKVVDENGIVPLVADWSDRGPEIGQILESLGSKQVPVIAIFPAGRPNDPIVLTGGYTKATLIDRLNQAATSQPATVDAKDAAAEDSAAAG